MTDELRIGKDELKKRLESGQATVVIDARSAERYEQAGEQIAGALRIPPDQLETRLQQIPAAAVVIIYDDGAGEEASSRMAAALRAKGWPDARALDGGFSGWQSSGYPLEDKVDTRPTH
jgi:3-mercaptopyruvate sulfurtransferase SseA